MALTRWYSGAVLLVVALLVSRHAHSATVADGQHAYDEGRFADARRIWAALVQGDSTDDAAQAGYGLGLIYDLGNGVRSDAQQAFRWYLYAAQAGVTAAEFNVAVMADSGTGTPRDPAIAATWYAKAALHGNHRAEYNLGLLYQTGNGVARNPAMAKLWFSLAERGNVTAARAAMRTDKTIDPPPFVEDDTHRPTLLSVRPTAPVNVELPHPTTSIRSAAFVWVAPQQQKPVRYYLEVVSGGRGEVKNVFGGFTDLSACLVELPSEAALYRWRVYTVSKAAGNADYVASEWSLFSEH